MFSPPKNEKTLRSRIGTKGNASAVPPANSPRQAARFSDTDMSKMDNGITRPTLLTSAFRRRLTGESQTLHASGFHHPAFAVGANPAQGSPITAFSY
jgi:hypothetical protein